MILHREPMSPGKDFARRIALGLFFAGAAGLAGAMPEAFLPVVVLLIGMLWLTMRHTHAEDMRQRKEVAQRICAAFEVSAYCRNCPHNPFAEEAPDDGT